MARRIAHAPLAACKAPKSSRKKQAKMERVQRQMERAALVASANSEPDLFSGLNERRVFCTSEGVEVHVNSLHGPQLSPIQLDQCLSLLTSNMRTMYEDSGWGWDEKSKRDGLLAGDSRILLLSAVPEPADGARNGDDGDDADGWVLVEHPAGEPKTKYVPPSQPFTSSAKELTSPSELTSSASNPGGFLGFVHMQFCIEAEKAVLYVLELQLVEAARNQGLGKHLMALVESIARQQKMSALMLTVFKENTRAMSFYKNKLSYNVDATSPSQCGCTTNTYEILSKQLSERASP